MAKFQEVMKQRDRMCKHYLSTDRNCGNCPLDKAREGTMLQCFRYIAEYYQEAENVIMEWAAENPEPVFPAWGEWLCTMGLVYYTKVDGVKTYFTRDIKIEEPIPADIAQKLGLESKEGV